MKRVYVRDVLSTCLGSPPYSPYTSKSGYAPPTRLTLASAGPPVIAHRVCDAELMSLEAIKSALSTSDGTTN
jgi:hypothetical protein